MSDTTPSKCILIVEDEADIAELMAIHLRRDGFEPTLVTTGEAGLEISTQKRFGLAVIDWMLPGQSGIEVCKKLQGKLPILMVTARTDPSDIVMGLELGADDYLTKPFEVPVFLARVRALIRRSYDRAPSDQRTLTLGKLKLALDRHEVHCGDHELKLTPSEFKLLTALMRNEGRVLSREALVDLVQGEGVSVVDRTVDTHVFGLRKKLDQCADVIETIRGVGYRVRSP